MAKKETYQYETIEDFAGKMDWEGGIYGFASYGCKASEIKDKQLSKLWKEFLMHYKEAEKVSNKIYKYFDQHLEEGLI